MKKYFALAILAAATTVIATPQEDSGLFSTRDEALKAAGLDIYESPKNAEVIKNAPSNIKDIPTSVYSGTWLEYDENKEARQIIAVKSLQDVRKSADENIKYVFVKYSTEELEGIRKDIFSLFREKKDERNDLILGIAINDQKTTYLYVP